MPDGTRTPNEVSSVVTVECGCEIIAGREVAAVDRTKVANCFGAEFEEPLIEGVHVKFGDNVGVAVAVVKAEGKVGIVMAAVAGAAFVAGRKMPFPSSS